MSFSRSSREGIVAEVPPVEDEARRGWRSGQNPSALQAGKGFWEPQEGMTFPFIFSFAKIVSLVSARRSGVTFVPGDTTHPSAYGIHLP